MPATVYYREGQVVLHKDGQDVLVYKSVQELVEAHIKGLLAITTDDEQIRELLRKYHSD